MMLLSSLIRRQTHFEQMLTTFDGPLAEALLSQTQFLTRLGPFLTAVPTHAVDLLFALQHTF